MSLTKTFTKLMLCMLCLTLNMFSVINADAGRILNFKTDPAIESRLKSESKKLDSSNQQVSKAKPIIKKDKKGKKTIDTEPDIKMSKKQEGEFNNCKSLELSRRTKRNTNKITSCRKNPILVTDELTDQDYNILIDSIQEKEEIDKGLDMTKELSVEEIIGLKNVQVCDENLTLIQSNSSNYRCHSQLDWESLTIENLDSSLIYKLKLYSHPPPKWV